MNFQDAIERAIALRVRAKNENNDDRRARLLELAQDWEAWAEYCRERAAKGEAPSPASQPPEDI